MTVDLKKCKCDCFCQSGFQETARPSIFHFCREKMAQAYDFALDKMGLDILSFPIWNDYINFLKSVEAVGSYAENQKITAIRKVYQRGIINPMANIESLW